VGPMAQQERRDEAMRSKGANKKGKHISVRAPMAHRPARRSGGLWGRDGLAQQTGSVGPDPRKNSNGS
jgi:hypothetical protein